MSNVGSIVLVLNAGSSSLKFAAFAVDRDVGPDLIISGNIEEIGGVTTFRAKSKIGTGLGGPVLQPGRNHDEAIGALLPWLKGQLGGARIVAAGHRVVHGGTRFSAPAMVTPDVLDALVELIPLAPLHEPANIAGIRAIAVAEPSLPQVACFDSAFHRGQADVVQMFGLPHEFFEQGIRRYGFHGLSYEWIASCLPELDRGLAKGRCVVLHLGNGASMCAIRDGVSVASTMGFTAVDGLPMGTRSGSVDPGVLLYLLEQGHDRAEIAAILYKRSGLLGISGLSSDMRVLLESAEPRAILAVDYFVHRILRELGSLACSMGGLDGIVFTAGIGENAASIRERVVHGAAWLGFELDPQANAACGPKITTATSRIPAYVVPTDENLMIAKHTAEMMVHALHLQ